MYVQCLTASSALQQRFSTLTAAALLKGRNSIALGFRDGSSRIRYSWSQESSKENRCWTARLRSASWIRITSSLTFVCLDLYFIFLSFPQRLQIHCTPHSTDKTSLHWRRYFTLFLKSASPYSMLSSGMSLGWLNIVAHGVKTGSWASPSTYDRGRLFGATSTSSKTSSSSFNVRLAWQILLYYWLF